MYMTRKVMQEIALSRRFLFLIEPQVLRIPWYAPAVCRLRVWVNGNVPRLIYSEEGWLGVRDCDLLTFFGCGYWSSLFPMLCKARRQDENLARCETNINVLSLKASRDRWLHCTLLYRAIFMVLVNEEAYSHQWAFDNSKRQIHRDSWRYCKCKYAR